MVQHLNVVRAADGLGVSWNTEKDAVLAGGQARVIIDGPGRFDGVAEVGVNEPRVASHAAAGTSTSP